jgi:hypothetical protein
MVYSVIAASWTLRTFGAGGMPNRIMKTCVLLSLQILDAGDSMLDNNLILTILFYPESSIIALTHKHYKSLAPKAKRKFLQLN